jgi:hypothetical protein
MHIEGFVLLEYPVISTNERITDCRAEIFSVTRNADKYFSQWPSIRPSRILETSELILTDITSYARRP